MPSNTCQYKSILIACFVVVYWISGCSALVIKDEDDGATMIGKVLYRSVFALVTLGISEFHIREAAQEYEREQLLAVYEARVMEFLEKEEITQAEAKRMILKEKARLWGEGEKQE